MDEKEFKKLFGLRIRELRKEKNLTQEQLAELVWLDTQHFCKMENGNHFPSLKNLLILAEVLEVNVYDLFVYDACEEEKIIQNIKFNINKLKPKELKLVKHTISTLIDLRNS